MMLLRVTNIQRGCVYDGPGVRTTVFLKGCSLHCPWCCNPETISYEEQWFIDDRKCVLRQGRSSQLCAPCERQDGTRSIQSCPYGVAEPTSYDYSTEELLEILLKDKELYKESHGGVTFSGGEPLLQSEKLVSILSELKGLNVHIVLETTLVASEKAINLVLPYVDLYIIDLKLQPQMKLYNHRYLKKMQQMLSYMQNKKKYFRMVFVNEVLDKIDDVLSTLQFLDINKIELLLCHNLGKNKYLHLSYKYANYSASPEKMAYFFDYLVENGIETNLLMV